MQVAASIHFSGCSFATQPRGSMEMGSNPRPCQLTQKHRFTLSSCCWSLTVRVFCYLLLLCMISSCGCHISSERVIRISDNWQSMRRLQRNSFESEIGRENGKSREMQQAQPPLLSGQSSHNAGCHSNSWMQQKAWMKKKNQAAHRSSWLAHKH